MPRSRNGVRGEYLAQLDNRDPFAPPVWRSPVYRTPEAVILVVQLLRLIWRLLWFALTHPLVDAAAVLMFATWLGLGWPGIAGLGAVAVIGLAGLQAMQPVWFARFVAVPVRDWWRWWFYRRWWKAASRSRSALQDWRAQGRPGSIWHKSGTPSGSGVVKTDHPCGDVSADQAFDLVSAPGRIRTRDRLLTRYR